MSEWRPHVERSATPTPNSLVFAFGDGLLLVNEGVPRLSDLPSSLLEGAELLHVGTLGGEHCFAVAVAATEGMTSLRSAFELLPEPLPAIAGRAAQVVEWDRAHRFCGRCAAPTQIQDAELARACPACGAVYYPRINPAVIMLVERGDLMLLARRPEGRFFSALAGFVDPGETFEEAVRREVREEVGLELDDVRYFGSQPWPFPSQLMIAFGARSDGGEIEIDEHELAEARWFRAGDELPQIPSGIAIARWLIDDFLARAQVKRRAS